MTFTMKYTYDWLGRMQTMTFPNWIDQNLQFIAGEGEKMSYVYDLGGNIDRITGFHQTREPAADERAARLHVPLSTSATTNSSSGRC